LRESNKATQAPKRHHQANDKLRNLNYLPPRAPLHPWGIAVGVTPFIGIVDDNSIATFLPSTPKDILFIVTFNRKKVPHVSIGEPNI
jgi:hypothetical protein